MYRSTEYSVKKTTYFGVLSHVMFGDRVVQYAVVSGHFSIISLSRIMARFLNYNYYLAEDFEDTLCPGLQMPVRYTKGLYRGREILAG
jgi:hypothetical protein